MNLQDKIQVWNAVGTWLAAIGTLSAVGFSLWITLHKDKVRLKTWAGVRTLISGDPDLPNTDVMMIQVTNLGERSVTISTIGWRVGKGKKRRFAMQMFGDPGSSDYPKILNHGDVANFYLGLDGDWAEELMTNFIQNTDHAHLATFVAQVHTSVGQTVDCEVERGLLDHLVKHQRNNAAPQGGSPPATN